MMDYTKQCWSCKKLTMVKRGSFYACENCGATWNEVPKSEASPVDLESDAMLAKQSTSPSKSLKCRVKKAREEQEYAVSN